MLLHLELCGDDEFGGFKAHQHVEPHEGHDGHEDGEVADEFPQLHREKRFKTDGRQLMTEGKCCPDKKKGSAGDQSISISIIMQFNTLFNVFVHLLPVGLLGMIYGVECRIPHNVSSPLQLPTTTEEASWTSSQLPSPVASDLTRQVPVSERLRTSRDISCNS